MFQRWHQKRAGGNRRVPSRWRKLRGEILESRIALSTADPGVDVPNAAEIGNPPCSADWLIRNGDLLRIVGNSQNNEVSVSVDTTGRLTVSAASNCSHEFTDIHRIVSQMHAGNDKLSMLAPLTGTLHPIDVEVQTHQGNDQVVFENWLGKINVELGAGDDQADFRSIGGGSIDPAGKVRELRMNVLGGVGNDNVNIAVDSFFNVFTDLDLGAGNDTADLRYIGGGTIDPAGKVRELRMNVLGGVGDDTINAVAAAFFKVNAQAYLGAGDDRCDFKLNRDPQSVEDVTSIVNMVIDGGGGFDGAVLDVQRTSIEDLNDTIEAIIANMEALSAAFASASESVRVLKEIGDMQQQLRQSAPSNVKLKFDGPNAAIDVTTGATDDLIRVQLQTRIDPTADGSVKFSAKTGGGDDRVELTATSYFDIITELNLGAGNDSADLRFIGDDGLDPAGKVRELRMNVLGGPGDDTIKAVVSDFFEVNTQANLGVGDDRFELSLNPDPLPVADLTSIVHILIDAGSGIDGVVLDVERISLTEVLESIFLTGIGLLAIDALFPVGVLSMAQSVRDGRSTGQSHLAATWDGSDLAVDFRTGITDDLIKLEIDPAADGSVRFTSATGDGNDSVQLLARAAIGMFVDLDLGAGHDTADLRYMDIGTPDPAGKVRELRVRTIGGTGNDSIRADVRARPSDLVFMDFDGGTGDDVIGVRYLDSLATTLPARPLHIHVLGGDGMDDLSLLVTTSRRRALLDLLLDGGNGRDRGSSTSNVKVKNCETILTPPTD